MYPGFGFLQVALVWLGPMSNPCVQQWFMLVKNLTSLWPWGGLFRLAVLVVSWWVGGWVGAGAGACTANAAVSLAICWLRAAASTVGWDGLSVSSEVLLELALVSTGVGTVGH